MHLGVKRSVAAGNGRCFALERDWGDWVSVEKCYIACATAWRSVPLNVVTSN